MEKDPGCGLESFAVQGSKWRQQEERRRYEELEQQRKPERQLQKIRGLAESGFRPEPTPCAYRGEHVTAQAPCNAHWRHSAHSQPGMLDAGPSHLPC